MSKESQHITVLTHATLETERFGVRTARGVVTSAIEEATLLAEARMLGAQLLILRCLADDLAATHALERAGALLMSTVVTFARTLVGAALPSEARHVEIRPAEQFDADRTADIARRAFSGYPDHYHADPRLDERRCDEVYAAWAWRSCREPGVADHVIVAVVDGVVQGFCTCRLDGQVVWGDLDAVDAAARGMGLHHALSAERIRWAAAQGASLIRVPIHLTQTRPQRTALRLGMFPESASHTFHLWP